MKKLISLVSLMTAFGCVDRVFFDINIPNEYEISIDGFISDQEGPYRISVLRTFDTESRENLRSGVSARVTMSDAEGNSEILSQVTSGVYETAVAGIRGKIGSVYKLKVELDDGRIYESTPDTMYTGGSMDSVRWNFTSGPSVNGIRYDFDIYCRSSANTERSDSHLMWRNKITFKTRTRPENEPDACYRIDKEARCNFVHPCSGLKNIGSDFNPNMVRVGPCTCCICWYDDYNAKVLLNDKISSSNGRYAEMMIDKVQMTGWNMMYKMRMDISIQSLSPQAFRFWKALRNQQTAVSNIFQPITGKIEGNFVQTAGIESKAKGIFYATSISSKYFYINRADIREELIPVVIDTKPAAVPCFTKFPNWTTTQPPFWVE